MKIEITIPESLEPYAHDFSFFVEVMARKLHANRHKGYGGSISPLGLLEACRVEINEAVFASGQFECAVECADVANYAFLAAMAAMRMTKPDFKQEQY